MMERQDVAEATSLEHLLPKERSVLHHIWNRFAGQSFDDDKLRSLRVQRLSGVEVQLAFLSLRQQRWVQAVKQGWGERLYFIPFDKLQILQEAFGNLEADSVPAAAVKLQHEGRSCIAVDMFNVLVYMAKNQVAITAKGVLHKKFIQKLGSIVGLTPSDVEGLTLQYDHADVYPPHVVIVLDLLFSFELVALEQRELRLNMTALRHWLALSREAMDRLVLLHMMERYVPGSAEYQHFTWQICHSSRIGGMWYYAQHMLAKGEEPLNGDPLRGRELSAGDAASWLRLLTGCGYTDLGMDHDGQFLFRWRLDPCSLLSGSSKDDTGSSRLFIQPDFDILIPPDVPYMVKFTAALCTERISDDVMTVYRLTRDSVAQAATAGMGPEAITAFFTEHAAAGIPENVYAALCQWGKELERAGRNESLRYAGAAPKDETEFGAGDEGDNRYALPRYPGCPSSGLIRPARSELVLEWDDSLPDKASIVPDLNRIPIMWTRDWRSYHGSTAKQMMEQALELSAKLEIAVDGSRMEFIPFQLERQPWKISGALYDLDSDSEMTGIVVQLGEGEWKEMRLVIP
ncbi:helicase-associated domain-containing protein [Paenibacillus sp. EZ-K15]|uniref:helicase-associated domain-containing protein n=1 Tax=Paenibacillus sp. EZ-K15 TaxID=2044275 RepID=UPI000BF7EC63|nr:helicase-associated domain-containing protein [Paenibacillus sp. EZ-K15]